MKRKVVSLFIMTLPLLLAVLLLQLPAFGAPAAQTAPTADDGNSAPQQIVIRQQIPVSFTLMAPPALTGTVNNTGTGNLLGALFSSITRSSNLTPTATTQTVIVTLTLDLQLTVTDTLTSTVPATVTLTLPDQGDGAAPVAVALGQVPLAEVVITPLAPVTAAPALTETAAVTTGAEVTETAGVTTPATSPAAAITGTVAITANLRSGPDTTFDVVGTTTAGQPVTIVARNGDGTWYLLNNGLWLAALLVDNVQGQPPLATEELVTALRAGNVITNTTPVTATASVTATGAVTPSTPVTATTEVTTTTPPTTGPILVPTPTAPQPAAQAVQPPRVTVDANLRAGPSITYPIIGGTVTGQEVNIVARNGDGSWFRLDNGGWVAAFLLANPPITTTVPLFVEEGAQSGTTPTVTAAPIPTATITATATATNTTPILGVRENLYTIRVDGIVDGYDFTLNKIDDLVNQAGDNVALLQDRAWIVEMTTAITLLRTTSDEIRTLTAPPIFTGAHAILLEAATSFTRAADLLAEGVDQLNTDLLDQAFAEITAGTNRLTRAQNAIAAATP
ncbi:MAG: SH3 domain-containing protein [Caldilinea sp. CFX5]|nr:SH3 domain-containing protein [Caldilinea sp. CFX5]